MMNTGSQQFGRPSIGSWTLYGLGSESDDLPGFVVLTSARRGPAAAPATRAAAFCRRSTTACRSAARATRCCISPTRRGSTPRSQRDSLDALDTLNDAGLAADRRPGDRHPDPKLRDGLPDADQRPRADGPRQGTARRRSTCTASEPGKTPASPTTACSPGGWSSAACASCNSSTKPGTSTAT